MTENIFVVEIELCFKIHNLEMWIFNFKGKVRFSKGHMHNCMCKKLITGAWLIVWVFTVAVPIKQVLGAQIQWCISLATCTHSQFAHALLHVWVRCLALQIKPNICQGLSYPKKSAMNTNLEKMQTPISQDYELRMKTFYLSTFLEAFVSILVPRPSIEYFL